MNERTFSIEALNAMNARDFTAALASIFENSPWIPKIAWRERPFRTVQELHQALCRIVRKANHSQKLALIRAHPELADSTRKLAAESESEQRSASLDRLAEDEQERFVDLNRRYRELFGFPFIICVKQHDKQSILENFQRRLNHSPAVEVNSAIDEICKIAYFRLLNLTG